MRRLLVLSLMLVALGVIMLWRGGNLCRKRIAAKPDGTAARTSLEPLARPDLTAKHGLYIVNSGKQDIKRVEVTSSQGRYAIQGLKALGKIPPAHVPSVLPRGYFDQRPLDLRGDVKLEFVIEYADGATLNRVARVSMDEGLLQIAIEDGGRLHMR